MSFLYTYFDFKITCLKKSSVYKMSVTGIFLLNLSVTYSKAVNISLCLTSLNFTIFDKIFKRGSSL